MGIYWPWNYLQEKNRGDNLILKFDWTHILVLSSWCCSQKSHEIEALGKDLYEQINRNVPFRNDFQLDAAIEEAITSAIYEGAHITWTQAEQLIASGLRPKNKDDLMLINNFKAMKWVKDNQKNL